MPKSIKDIILPNADWTVKEVDFDSPEIQESIREVHRSSEEAEERKQIDSKKLEMIINPYKSI